MTCSSPSCSSLSHSKGSVSYKKTKKKKKHKHKDRDVCKWSTCKCAEGLPKIRYSPVFFICRGMDMRMTTALHPAGSVAVCDGLYMHRNTCTLLDSGVFLTLAELQTQRREQGFSLVQARADGVLTSSPEHRLQTRSQLKRVQHAID